MLSSATVWECGVGYPCDLSYYVEALLSRMKDRQSVDQASKHGQHIQTIYYVVRLLFLVYIYRIQPNKHRVCLKKIGQCKNVKESVVISVHPQFFFLSNTVTV